MVTKAELTSDEIKVAIREYVTKENGLNVTRVDFYCEPVFDQLDRKTGEYTVSASVTCKPFER